MTQLNIIIRAVTFVVCLWLPIISAARGLHPTDYERNWSENLIQDIKQDFTNYMDNDNLILLGDSFLAAGILANSGLDRAFAQHWQNDIRSSASDNLLAFPKTIGGLSFYYAPIYLASISIGHMHEHTLLGNVLYHWGYRSLRTFLVGGIQQVFLTHLLGSGRPKRGEDSKWQPFRQQTGVSGHAFYGAIPFITAAMMSDPPLLKYGLYALSTLPGISRLNNDCHYLSQVILGWTLAFLSANSVYQSDSERNPAFQVGVHPRSNGAMLAGRLLF